MQASLSCKVGAQRPSMLGHRIKPLSLLPKDLGVPQEGAGSQSSPANLPRPQGESRSVGAELGPGASGVCPHRG